MELTQYLHLIRKWRWLILITTILLGGIAFIARSLQSPGYETHATVAIGRYIDAPNPDNSQILTGISLAQTYAELVTTHDILQNVIDSLRLPINVSQLRTRVDTRILTGTSLLVITASYDDPNLVTDIANKLAEQLIAQSPSNLTPDQISQINLANQQIDILNVQIGRANQRIASIEKQLTTVTDADEIATLTAQENSLTTQVNQSAATIAQFSGTIASLQQRTNSLDIVERAQIPLEPTGLNALMMALLGALLGAVSAFGIALFIEYADTVVRTTERVTQLLTLPVWGSITQFGKKGDSYPQRLITNERLQPEVAESYRALRTNLTFAHENANKVYVVTSPGPMEGKTITAANLAISLAQAGSRVLLIDADLRRPKIQEIFSIPNDVGLTALLFANPTKLNDALSNGTPNDESTSSLRSLRKCIQQTNIQNLYVIPSGLIPANPAELLVSPLVRHWIDAFRKSLLLDVIIVDTPPALLVSDASLLSASVKANVIMVLDARKTRLMAATKTKVQFEQLGVPLSGVVLNCVHPRDEDGSYGYGYAYYPAMSKHGANSSQNGFEGKRRPVKEV